ncbi:amidohydrolase family protein [Amycolatopsis sp. NPDC059657]|uniref:amidohydrolase family protein n=1 Tax=Amycolatopsis sp. NPDC059657 TaxID=3346899 RepID=UPI003671056A
MIVDVHAHLFPPALVERLPIPPSIGDVPGMLAAKAAAGIDLTIVGSPTGASTMAAAGGQSLAELASYHDWLAETVQAHPDRLRAYAWCDPFGGDGMLADVNALLATEEFAGVIVNPSIGGKDIADPAADEFLAMVAASGKPMLLHSGADPLCTRELTDYGLIEMVGRFCDVTLGLAALCLSGQLERHPDLVVVGTSCGAGLPLLPSRLDLAWAPRHWGGRSRPGTAPRSSHTGPRRSITAPSELMRRLYVDTTTDSPHLLRAAVDLLGPEHVLFGSDAPPVPVDHGARIGMVRSLGLGEEATGLMLGGNAQRLYGIRSSVPAGRA